VNLADDKKQQVLKRVELLEDQMLMMKHERIASNAAQEAKNDNLTAAEAIEITDRVYQEEGKKIRPSSASILKTSNVEQ
jgi:hypothetical protein